MRPQAISSLISLMSQLWPRRGLCIHSIIDNRQLHPLLQDAPAIRQLRSLDEGGQDAEVVVVEPRAEGRLPWQHRPLLVLFFQSAWAWVRSQSLQNMHRRHVWRERGHAAFRHRVHDHHCRGGVHRCITGSHELAHAGNGVCVRP